MFDDSGRPKLGGDRDTRRYVVGQLRLFCARWVDSETLHGTSTKVRAPLSYPPSGGSFPARSAPKGFRAVDLKPVFAGWNWGRFRGDSGAIGGETGALLIRYRSGVDPYRLGVELEPTPGRSGVRSMSPLADHMWDLSTDIIRASWNDTGKNSMALAQGTRTNREAYAVCTCWAFQRPPPKHILVLQGFAQGGFRTAPREGADSTARRHCRTGTCPGAAVSCLRKIDCPHKSNKQRRCSIAPSDMFDPKCVGV